MVRAIALFVVVSLSAWAQSGPVREVSSPALIAHAPIPAFYNGYLYALGQAVSITPGHYSLPTATLLRPSSLATAPP
jgi:hypothetical protein